MNPVVDGLREALVDAYARGYEAGARDARSRVSEFAASHAPPRKRVPRGSIRPAVLDAIRVTPGMRSRDIARLKGINETSVRSTLHMLSHSHQVVNKDGFWFIA